MLEKPMIKECLLLLHVCGLNPLDWNVWCKCRAIVTAILINILFWECFLAVIFQWKGLDSMQGLTFAIMIQQAFHRLATIIVNRKHFCNTLLLIEEFDTLQKFGQLRKNLQDENAGLGKKILIFTTGFYVVCLILICLGPLIFQIRNIILPYYHFCSESPYYEIILISSYLQTTYVSLFLLLPFEFLFAAFIVYLLCELMVLKAEAKDIVPTNSLSSLKEEEDIHLINIRRFVKHHLLVFMCISNINNMYTTLTLNQFLSSMLALCCCFGSMMFGRSSLGWTWYVTFITALLILMGQLLVCCIGGTILMQKCEEVSIAAYDTEWWRITRPSLRKSLVLIMKMAGKSNMLTAGGIFPLNLESFAQVVKTAYSFYSVVKSVYDK